MSVSQGSKVRALPVVLPGGSHGHALLGQLDPGLGTVGTVEPASIDTQRETYPAFLLRSCELGAALLGFLPEFQIVLGLFLQLFILLSQALLAVQGRCAEPVVELLAVLLHVS